MAKDDLLVEYVLQLVALCTLLIDIYSPRFRLLSSMSSKGYAIDCVWFRFRAVHSTHSPSTITTSPLWNWMVLNMILLLCKTLIYMPV